MAFHFDLKFQMENSLFTRFLPAVPCVLKLLRGGISQAKNDSLAAKSKKKSPWPFSKEKKKCKGCIFVAQKTSAYIIFFRPHIVIN